jgi:hypothetical protein
MLYHEQELGQTARIYAPAGEVVKISVPGGADLQMVADLGYVEIVLDRVGAYLFHLGGERIAQVKAVPVPVVPEERSERLSRNA